jgi:hypothetical protein
MCWVHDCIDVMSMARRPARAHARACDEDERYFFCGTYFPAQAKSRELCAAGGCDHKTLVYINLRWHIRRDPRRSVRGG